MFAKLPKAPATVSRKAHCSGDEASVSLVETNNAFFNRFGRGAGKKGELVERFRPLCPSKNRPLCVFFSEREGDQAVYSLSTPLAQILHYYAMQLAHSFYPANLPRVFALRFSEDGKKRCAVVYSEFVPDTTGVISRRKESMEKHYRWQKYIHVNSYEKLNEITVEPFDKLEYGLCRNLKARELASHIAGIHIAHPAANYHVRDGEPVFFEIFALSIEAIVRFISRIPDYAPQRKRMQLYFSLIVSTLIADTHRRLVASDRIEGYSVYHNWKIYMDRFPGDFAGFAKAVLGSIRKNETAFFNSLESVGFSTFEFMKGICLSYLLPGEP